MSEYFETSDQCRIAYRWDGPEGAPVLVLSNSLGTSKELWDAQLDAFTERYRLLRYDQRGHGQSDAPSGPYSIERLGLDVVEMLEANEIATAHFCGLSLGGMTGQWLGTNAGDRIGRLILANTSAYMGPPSAWQERIELVLTDGMATMAELACERWFTAGFRASSPDEVAAIKALLHATPPEGYAGCCAAIRDMDQRASVAGISVPTLVIGGSLDPATPPPHSEQLSSAIEGAELVFLEAAHLSNVEQPDAFNAAVLNFLAG